MDPFQLAPGGGACDHRRDVPRHSKSSVSTRNRCSGRSWWAGMRRRLMSALLIVCAWVATALTGASAASGAPADFSVAVHTTPVVAPGGNFMVIYVDIEAIDSVPQTDIT